MQLSVQIYNYTADCCLNYQRGVIVHLFTQELTKYDTEFSLYNRIHQIIVI